ncbi:hypothetical protein pb186bvf_003747 [Paramecium bursaria]
MNDLSITKLPLTEQIKLLLDISYEYQRLQENKKARKQKQKNKQKPKIKKNKKFNAQFLLSDDSGYSWDEEDRFDDIQDIKQTWQQVRRLELQLDNLKRQM